MSFFFSSRRRHTRFKCDWSSDVCSSDLVIQAFWLSCNTAFGQIGIRLGGATLRNYATRFGWNSSNLTIPMAVSPSVGPPVTDRALTAHTAIGHLSDSGTPPQGGTDPPGLAKPG